MRLVRFQHTALATSYSNNKLAMIPFYIYYSMFGFKEKIWLGH